MKKFFKVDNQLLDTVPKSRQFLYTVRIVVIFQFIIFGAINFIWDEPLKIVEAQRIFLYIFIGFILINLMMVRCDSYNKRLKDYKIIVDFEEWSFGRNGSYFNHITLTKKQIGRITRNEFGINLYKKGLSSFISYINITPGYYDLDDRIFIPHELENFNEVSKFIKLKYGY
jgi:hypothetical protein